MGLGLPLKLGEANCLSSELWAILKGLEYGWERGGRQVVLESDSRMVVSLIKSQRGNFSSVVPLIQRIWNYLNKEWVVRIVHCIRESNALADCLAAMAVRGNQESQTWAPVPESVREAWRSDLISCGSTRWVSSV